MTTSRRLLLSLLYAFLLVAVLTGLGLAVQAFHYPLFPGIALAGAIFSSGVESDHRLRFEVAAVVFNTVLYGIAIFFLLLAPRRSRRRRRAHA
jgi:hypothetical protein